MSRRASRSKEECTDYLLQMRHRLSNFDVGRDPTSGDFYPLSDGAEIAIGIAPTNPSRADERLLRGRKRSGLVTLAASIGGDEMKDAARRGAASSRSAGRSP